MSFSILSCRNKAFNSRVRVLFSHFYKIGHMVEEDVNLRSATSYWKYFYGSHTISRDVINITFQSGSVLAERKSKDYRVLRNPALVFF